MFINHDGRVYKIKANYRKGLEEDYEAKILKALSSVYIGGFVNMKEAFSLPFEIGHEYLLFTRDNLLDTEEKDEAKIIINALSKTESNSILDHSKYLTNLLKELTGNRIIDYVSMEKLGDGKMYSANSESEDKKACILLTVDSEMRVVVGKGVGNSNLDLNQMTSNLRRKMVSVELR